MVTVVRFNGHCWFCMQTSWVGGTLDFPIQMQQKKRRFYLPLYLGSHPTRADSPTVIGPPIASGMQTIPKFHSFQSKRDHLQKNLGTNHTTLFYYYYLEGYCVQPWGLHFLSPWATMLWLRLDCSRAALITPQKVSSIWKRVELKMLDFSDQTRNGISILISAADRQDTCGFKHDCCSLIKCSQRLMSRWKYQFSYDHRSQASWAQPVCRWVKLSGEWEVLL